MTGILINKKRKMPCEYRDTQSITMEAETEVLKLQAKKHLGLPEARRGKEGSSPRAFRESMALSKP